MVMSKGLKAQIRECAEGFVSEVLIPKEHILMLRINSYLCGIWPYVILEAEGVMHETPDYVRGIRVPYPRLFEDEEVALERAETLKYKLNLLALRMSEIRITEDFGNFVVLDGEEFVANCVGEAHAELIKQDLIEKL